MNNKSDFVKTIGFGILEIGVIVAVIVGIVYLIKYIIKKSKKNKTQEPFTQTTKTIDNQYGNIIYNKGAKNVKNNTMVVLPGRFRITGIKVNTTPNNNTNNNSSNNNSNNTVNKKDVSSKYKVYIADNEEDIANPDVRKLVSCGDNSNSVLDINTLYNNPTNFEKDNNGLFVGQVLLITTDDSNSDIKDIKPLPSTLEIMVLGLEPFALSYQDYNKYMVVSPTNNNGKDVKVGYLKLNAITDTTNNNNYRIKYSNTIDNNSNKYAIDGPNRLAFEVNEDNPFIFFSKPIIVNNLYIYKGDTKIEQNEYTLYGTESISKRDRANFKLQQQSFDEKHMIVEGEKCPNVGEMINKQLQAQQICEALEYKDKARNKKLAYEKDKIYLGKLAQQDKEIEELEDIVKGLIERKNTRIENNQGSNIDEVEKEMKRVEKIRKDAENYLKSSQSIPANLRVKVNLDPEFDYVKKTAKLN